MANPDIKLPTTNSLTLAIPVSILFLLITIFTFQLRDNIPSFKLILWVGLPIITFFITSGVNIISQYTTCKQTNIGKAMLGGLPSMGAVLLGLGISSIEYCRIPVTSVFAPLAIGQSIDVTKSKSSANINSLKSYNSKECCSPKLTLESVEMKYPFLAGISYGFYIMFSILFGMVIGTGISIIC